MPDETTGETTATEGRQAPEDAGTSVPSDAAEAPAPAKRAAAKKATAKKAPAKKAATKKAPAKKAAAAPVEASAVDEALPLDGGEAETPPAKAAKKTTTRKTPAKRTTKKAAAAEPAGEAPVADAPVEAAEQAEPAAKPAKKTAAKKTAAKKTSARKKAEPAPVEPAGDAADGEATEVAEAPVAGSQAPLFQPPVAARKTAKKAAKKTAAKPAEVAPAAEDEDEETALDPALAEDGTPVETEDAPETEDADGDQDGDQDDEDGDEADGEGSPARRRRRRGGRRRRRSGSGSGGQGGGGSEDDDEDEGGSEAQADGSTDTDAQDADGSDQGPEGDGQGDGQGEGSGSSRRRRRRRRSGEGGGDDSGDEPAQTTTRVRSSRTGEDQITSLSGSTRLEAKKQRRREGREAGRRRAPIVSEAEFLARRESVERVMVIREREDLTQIGVLEDKVLVEHYVARESQTSIIGNVYLGRVQNVLPSMEAAFIDIGKGRNAVLYAGEVNWSSLGHKEGQPRKIESVLSSGQSVLVQVTKDPIGAKGARLTSQVSLAGRFLVYVPDGTTSGISRKLPDTERSRLKALLKEIVPDTAGVIVRTAAEGASEEELTRDVERLKARWEDIEKKSKGSAPQLLYGEPDLTLKVVRDLFTEDFSKLVIQGDGAWETVQSYVTHVAPDLAERLERFEPATEGRDAGKDLFATYRVEEQIAKGLDRKVWLPSGGSLVIDRTEAMTVVDVNTGKFTGSGGNLEETVTKNNLEAAEEIVRQLRLRDIGGIIVVDFIDMVLESNRDLVLRRLVECLGRDRTRHQVAEVTSLGLVQMTRKRIGTGLVETFSENCTHCQGRGVVIHDHPVDPRGGGADDDRGGRRGGDGGGGSKRSRGGRGKGSEQSSGGSGGSGGSATSGAPSPKDIAAMPRHEKSDDQPAEQPAETASGTSTGTSGDDTGTASEPQAASAPAEPRVTTRSRSQRSSGSRSPRDAQDGAETPSAVPAEAEPAPRAEPVVEKAEPAPRAEPVVEKAEPVAEKPAATSGVVTRTRRAARRTGPLTTGEGAALVVDSTPAPAPEQAAQAPSAPAPKVVTRTRSSRPARPATQAGTVPSMEQATVASGVGEPATSGMVEPGTAETEPAAASVEHVPVKRKGARKR